MLICSRHDAFFLEEKKVGSKALLIREKAYLQPLLDTAITIVKLKCM